MNGSPIDLSALQDFAMVVGHGGFGRASRASGRPKATLSRRISELEGRLGVRLFERGVRALKLTEEGKALHARVEAPLGDIVEAAEAVQTGASRPRGRLRVSTPVLFGHIYMGRLAWRFAALYPEIQLEVLAGDRHVEPVEEDVDVVIRVNPKPDELLTGRRFMTDRLLAVSTGPAPPADERAIDDGTRVRAPAVVLSRSSDEAVWAIAAEGRHMTIEPSPVLRFSSVLMVRDAVCAGAGVALLPRSMVGEDVAAGRLVSWGELVDYDIDLWVLHTSRRYVSGKVSAFIDFLIAAFGPGGLRSADGPGSTDGRE